MTALIKANLKNWALVFLATAFLFSATVFAQNRGDLQETIFRNTDKLLALARSEQVSILSPSNFKNALDKYNQAQRDFKNGKQLKKIEKKLSEVRTYLYKCLDAAKLGKITFESTLKAREDALKANAPQYAEEQFNLAEQAFLSTAKKLEKGDIKNARRRVPGIDQKYRAAELNAIKISIIGNVRNLMKQAKEVEANKYSPIIYANARKLLNEAEAILNTNRRSETSAKEKAEAAEAEAKHAIFITRQTKWLKKNDKEWENFILDREIIIEAIARELGFTPTFDDGLDKPLKRIAQISRNLQNEKKELIKEVEEKNAELRKLDKDILAYREKEQGLQAELQEKRYKLEMKKRREDLIRSVEEMFAVQEAVMLRQGDDIIIRLIGLTFGSGKSTIEPELFRLLSTVQRAIRKFPSSPITIEGHTDSRGDARFNENLSYERAMAVKQYLLANMGLEQSRITALGYGESKPIATNETSEGRSKNRRIDVVISLGQEVL